MVRTMRFELTQESSYYPLKVACLPFHHVRFTTNILPKISIDFNLKFCYHNKKQNERRDAMSTALFHVTVKAVVVYHNQMLLLKKVKQSKDGLGYWELPGGGMEYGESLEAAIKREIKEECGLEVDVIHPLSTFHVLRKEHEIVGLIFLCEAKSKQVLLSNEHTAYQFVSKEDSLNYLSPTIYDNAFFNHPEDLKTMIYQLKNES